LPKLATRRAPPTYPFLAYSPVKERSKNAQPPAYLRAGRPPCSGLPPSGADRRE
jgi:hypothetical protein